ncbi:3-phosphoshikimate 1-carboxyvinyltransferase [Mesonia maritima]|uniref:3-phosphoshikimate 1-carboxyvinyltransferase n=1 Tax=Mesonia maritima TaxID=1793873 RepID=A0ABU1K927_9FLAO|nr:3-phosphoshikimate 1-carboxyvinyltransferase [Mesonia maritima]MDR6302096.1 3-phosphoshikimate 1-carboxyvinyltransferase [Mesonia maritima]
MNLLLSNYSKEIKGQIQITGSKSESNRLLILQAIYPKISLQNLSNCDDTKVLQNSLKTEEKVIDIHHAGTAMRFLTAYFAQKENSEILLTGSNRMQERPIKILVEALRALDAKIEYEKEEGFPPLKISGKRIEKNLVEIDATVSSQYITALMLIAPSLQNGLTIQLKNKPTSVSYINMTLAFLEKLNIKTTFKENIITIKPAKNILTKIEIESDWSSASYFYSIVALSEQAEITLSNFRENSIQGDRVVADYFKEFGVETTFYGNAIQLKKNRTDKLPKVFKANLISSPDLAQTIAVTCFGLKIDCHLEGLRTLKIKETDRLQALKNELGKLGAKVSITSESIYVKASAEIKENQKIKTYQDHRMAMAFAPLSMKVPIEIEEAEVVSKSFPDFWQVLKPLGFSVKTTL